MKSIQTSVLMSLLAAFAFGCTSSTALQTSESDDMYYASTDKTVRQQTSNLPAETGNSDEAVNPEYPASGTATNAGSTAVTNNYNYYDSDYSYASRSRTVRSPYRNWSYYDYGYYNDPYWYAPGAFVTPYYSAAYCYPGMYDPFWGPAYYPYSGITVSIGYGFGYGGYYGGHRPWGYNPYGGYYGGGYGYGNGYYQGFYEGYYAGNNSYYGVNRKKVNYGPRGDRSNVPNSAPASATGRPNGNRQDTGGISPGRPMAPSGNNVTSNGRPQRVVTNSNQTQPATPNQVNPGRPGRTTAAVQNQIGQDKTPAATRPDRSAGRPVHEVRPQNYEFQDRPMEQTHVQQGGNPRNTVSQQNNTPALQQEQPVRTNREYTTKQDRPVYQPQPGLSRPDRQPVTQQPRPEIQNSPVTDQAPQQQGGRSTYSRPSRSEQPQAPVIREDRSYSKPSQSGSSPSRNNNASPSNSGGRPRR